MKHLKYTALILPFMLMACGGESAAPAIEASAPAATPVAAAKPVAAKKTPMQRGRIMYKRCQACHTLAEGGKNKVGPNLWGMYGRDAGKVEGFAYSKAMLASGVTWTEETVDQYIARPKDFIKGNKMSFVGIKKQEDRDALQVYLKAETMAGE